MDQLTLIQDTVESQLSKRKVDLSPAKRKQIEAASRQSIAGFHIRNKEAEERFTDAALDAYDRKVNLFRYHKKDIKNDLREIGIKPLAVIPIQAWEAICVQAGLYLLAPDHDGKTVGLNPHMLGIKMTPRVKDALSNHTTLLKLAFPEQRSYHTSHTNIHATLVLPQPPQDVIDILIKLTEHGYRNLKVAAVPEAIGFAETVEEIFARARAREIERQRQLQLDPIVYIEYNSAAAIVAQFGDFPIERNVVERILESELFLGAFGQRGELRKT